MVSRENSRSCRKRNYDTRESFARPCNMHEICTNTFVSDLLVLRILELVSRESQSPVEVFLFVTKSYRLENYKTSC